MTQEQIGKALMIGGAAILVIAMIISAWIGEGK